jgi:multisubunit Na+/H+ antiporter MnhG subunit
MSDFSIDAVIFILLVLSVGFGGIGVIGLLLFPDIRSRMYTAFRATVISISAIILSVIIYALYTFIASGGDQYITLIFHSLVLLCIVAVANGIVYKTILDRTKPVSSCQISAEQNKDNNSVK